MYPITNFSYVQDMNVKILIKFSTTDKGKNAIKLINKYNKLCS